MRYLLIFLSTQALFASPPCLHPLENCKSLFQVQKETSIELYTSHTLEKVDPEIEKIVITVHGVLTNADEYYAWMLAAAKLEGVENRTLIISPHFKSDEDPKTPNELFWNSSDWKYGYQSSNLNPANKVSSFTVMDKLVENLITVKKFPNLKEITLIGHSAGGQYFSRYAVTGKLDMKFPVRYIVSNPSSYLYLNEARPTESPEKFSLPTVSDCPTYNDYAYGLKKRNSYSVNETESQLISNFKSRNITLLLGEMDTENESLDMSCDANLQGKNRWERGNNFFRYIKHTFTSANLKKITVPGVGHDSEKMYQSVEGRALIFR